MASNISSVTTQVGHTKAAPTTERATKTVDEGQDGVPQENVSIGKGDGEALTYANPRAQLAAERPDLNKLLEESERKVDEFMTYLRGLVKDQGLEWSKVASGEQKLSASAEEIDAAKQAISEDGEWGVKKTAERILSFAKYAIGGNPENMEKIRAAVQQGFDEAREMLGGSLPQISEDTYDAVMKEFDRWAKEGIPEGDTVSLAKPKVNEPKA
ncbi:DUF5610 domain-containing protein [Chitinolyticbacter meiyuanensis]|uniref:DUF5610 domain-containing protein n=1 Tax=Chitinolyticbacter meiyuanensis TaxID=682798 RepID=UPI0011E6074F|nr:DUF5610 domain-containing protein [Chitinolyticbacter meiyuanensis]